MRPWGNPGNVRQSSLSRSPLWNRLFPGDAPTRLVGIDGWWQRNELNFILGALIGHRSISSRSTGLSLSTPFYSGKLRSIISPNAAAY